MFATLIFISPIINLVITPLTVSICRLSQYLLVVFTYSLFVCLFVFLISLLVYVDETEFKKVRITNRTSD